ncbi:unnamed protein product, partial [Mesorhabditis spiculigera]
MVAASNGPATKLRILCLHGYRQNDVFFREKTGGMRKLFKKYADFTFINAPHVPSVLSEDRGEVRGWWFSKPDANFSSRDVTDLDTGFEESVRAVLDFIKENGPFDGLFGFSQGAAMVHLLLAKEQLGELKLDVKFAIIVSGFRSLSSQHERYNEVLIEKPSLHIYGTGDEMGNYMSDHKKANGSLEAENNEFRVYIHRRNKFIHAWLKITPSEIIVQRSKSDTLVFPLQYLRRYGYTSAGVFFFESGRRCATGEGLHTYQSQHAEAIFQLVQSRIQATANAVHSERARNQRDQRYGSVDHTPRIHPIQRYLSEGNKDISAFSQPNYNSLHTGDAKRRRPILAPPPRPRSLQGMENGRQPGAQPQYYVQNAHGHAQIIGNIITESAGPNRGSVSSLYNKSLSTSMHSYTNLPPTQFAPPVPGSDPGFRNRCSSACSNRSTASSINSYHSTPTTPTTKLFPIQWDGGAGSTSFLCYAQPATAQEPRTLPFSPPLPDERPGIKLSNPPGRYPSKAMLSGMRGIPLDEQPMAKNEHGQMQKHNRLNYAAMEAPLATAERTSRSPSIAGSCASLQGNSTTYAVIDPQRTKALQQAKNDVARANNSNSPAVLGKRGDD